MMLFCGWPPCVFVLLLLTVPCVVLMQLQRKDNGVMLTFAEEKMLTFSPLPLP